MHEFQSPESSTDIRAAQFLIDHQWQPARALDLLHQAEPQQNAELKREAATDNRSADQEKEARDPELYYRQKFAGLILPAARWQSPGSLRRPVGEGH